MSFSQFHQDTSRPSPSPAKALGCAMASSCHARNQPLCTISPSPAMTGTQRFLGLRDSWDSESYQIGTPKAPFQLCFNLANSLEEPRLSRLPGYFQFTDAPNLFSFNNPLRLALSRCFSSSLFSVSY